MTYEEYISKIAHFQQEMRESKRVEKNRCREINEKFRQDCANLKAKYMEDLAQLDQYRKGLLESEHMAGHCQREKLFLLQSKLCADYKEEHKLPPLRRISHCRRAEITVTTKDYDARTDSRHPC